MENSPIMMAIAEKITKVKASDTACNYLTYQLKFIPQLMVIAQMLILMDKNLVLSKWTIR